MDGVSQASPARAVAVLTSAEPAQEGAIRDTLLLDYEQRCRPSGIVRGLRGLSVEMDLPPDCRLRGDDRLVLSDGGLIEIVARPEPLLEVRAGDTASLARLAWLLGDHHISVDIHERRLRLRPSEPARSLLTSAGARLTEIEAPFEPEGGAYDHHLRR